MARNETNKVRQLQSLYRAKTGKEVKVHSLADKVYREGRSLGSMATSQANQGAAGRWRSIEAIVSAQQERHR